MKVRDCFASKGFSLSQRVNLEIGISGHKHHDFDLGDKQKKLIIECKAHKWTEGKNVPSAKMSQWNEAMFFFYAAPNGYEKILCVLKDFSRERNETLGEYYVRRYSHLIPHDVEIWELDEENGDIEKLTKTPKDKYNIK